MIFLSTMWSSNNEGVEKGVGIQSVFVKTYNYTRHNCF